MSRVQRIVDGARRVLMDKPADPIHRRWTDDDLIGYLNEGVNNFVMTTKCNRARAYLQIEINTAIYDLSQWVFSIDRIEYLGRVVKSISEEDLDRIDKDWHNTIGREVRYIVFNNLNMGSFRIYPKQDEDTVNNIIQNSPYGGLMDIVPTDDLFNLPTPEEFETTSPKFLSIYYTAKPTSVESVEDENLDIPDIYDHAMVYYISAQALRMDMDTQNRSFAMEQFQLYNQVVQRAMIQEASDNNTFNKRPVPYRGFA